MLGKYARWIGAFVLAVLVTVAPKYYAYFPGDVAVERWVQSFVPQDLNWAVGVSRTAEFPWVLLILALVSVLSWVPRGMARRAYLHLQLRRNVGAGKLPRPAYCTASPFARTGACVSTTFRL